MSALTSTIVAAGLIDPKISPWTARTAAEAPMSVTNMRLRTTSPSVKPASASAILMIANAARAWAPASPGWSEAPAGPASVVPATQHESPTTTARLYPAGPSNGPPDEISRRATRR